MHLSLPVLPMPLLRARLQRWPRPARIAVTVVAALYLLYLCAGNVFLNTPLFDAVTDRKPEKFHMDTGPAVTFWPGYVMAWNVRMRGHVNHTVYVLSADRASARLALWPLLRREVRLPWLHAYGVEADVQRVADAIAPPPRGDRGWTLRFDAIDSDSIRSARLGDLRLRGRGNGTVGFVKQLRGGPSELLPSRVAFAGAELSHGQQVLLDQATLAATFQYPRHYRDQAPGLQKLGITSATLEIDARSRGIAIDTGHDHTQVRATADHSRLQARLGLDKGQLSAGSRGVWRLPLAAGVNARKRGLLTLQLDAARDIRLQARLPRDPDTGSELQADLRLDGRALPLQVSPALFKRLSGTVKGQWPFESLNWIADLFVRKPWFQLQGAGLLQADLVLANGRLQPGSTVDVPKVQAIAEVAQVRLQGVAAAHGRIQAGNPDQADLRVSVPEFLASPVDSPDTRLFDGRDLQLALAGEAQLESLRKGMRATLAFNDAVVPDLRAYNRYLGGGAVRLQAGTGRLSGTMTLDGQGRIGRGSVDLHGKGARVQVAGLALAGDAHLRGRVQRADFDQKRLDLSGSRLELRQVRVGEDSAAASDWWGTLDVTRGQIDAATPFQVDAQARLQLRDAGPILGVFAERGDYPRWVLGLLDSGQVQADSRLRWRHGQLLLDELLAENKRVALRARLAVERGDPGKRRGDLYLRWGVLGAAVELDGEQRRWHLAGARDWYEGRPPLLPAAGKPNATAD